MPEAGKIEALLAQTKLFGSLAPSIRAAIREAMRETSYTAGQLIFSRGDPGSHLFLVVEGRVRLSVLTAEGRELAFAHAIVGDVFGEIAVLDQSTRSADATALAATRLMTLPAGAVERLTAAHPELARAFMKFLCARLREVSDHLEDIALLPIEARLARYLLARMPEEGSGSSDRITLGMSQAELALLLGASRPKVNAALIALEDVGALKRIGQELSCDKDILVELARQS